MAKKNKPKWYWLKNSDSCKTGWWCCDFSFVSVTLSAPGSHPYGKKHEGPFVVELSTPHGEPIPGEDDECFSLHEAKEHACDVVVRWLDDAADELFRCRHDLLTPSKRKRKAK